MKYRVWNGYGLKRYIYIFEYDVPNLRGKYLIPDFLNQDPYTPNIPFWIIMSIEYGCLYINAGDSGNLYSIKAIIDNTWR